jgi:hypothetical protein
MTMPAGPDNRGRMGGRGSVRGALNEGAVLVTVTVILLADPPGVSEPGETVQAAAVGAPVQVKFTFWLKPPSPLTLSVYIAD